MVVLCKTLLMVMFLRCCYNDSVKLCPFSLAYTCFLMHLISVCCWHLQQMTYKVHSTVWLMRQLIGLT